MAAPKNSTTKRSGRFYTWRGQDFWSVTTILKALPNENLVGWATKYTAETAVVEIEMLTKLIEQDQRGAVDWLKGAAYRARDKAADTGTAVHDAIEAYILGRPAPLWALEIKPRMTQFERFLSDWKPEFVMAEATVYNRTENYAGTLDSIAVLRGVPILLDVKTRGGSSYPFSGQTEGNVYDKDALQVAAYRHGEFVGMPDGSELPLPKTDAAAVLHLTNTGYRLVEVDAGPETFKNFLAVRDVHANWLNGRAKTVILGDFPCSLEAAFAQQKLTEVA